MHNQKIQIIIPTKNEEQTLGVVLSECLKLEPNYSVLIVDGHSTDNTQQIAKNFNIPVVLDNKKGKGDALRVGAKNSNAYIIVFMDADGSHDANDIPNLVKPILDGDADLVIASRMKGGSDELHGNLDQFIRNTGSNLAALLINWRFKSNVTDVMNGFRAIKRQAFLDLDTKTNDFRIEQEILLKSLKKKLKNSEVPSHEYERKGGQSKLETSQGWKMLWHILISLITK